MQYIFVYAIIESSRFLFKCAPDIFRSLICILCEARQHIKVWLTYTPAVKPQEDKRGKVRPHCLYIWVQAFYPWFQKWSSNTEVKEKGSCNQLSSDNAMTYNVMEGGLWGTGKCTVHEVGHSFSSLTSVLSDQRAENEGRHVKVLNTGQNPSLS